MKNFKLLVIVLIAQCQVLIGQPNLQRNWITGAGRSFVLSFVPAPQISIFDSNYNYYFANGNSCISDSNGKLLLLCNGFQLYDSTGTHLLNGDSLVPEKIYDRYNGFSILTQSSIIIPFSQGIYYCVSPPKNRTGYKLAIVQF